MQSWQLFPVLAIGAFVISFAMRGRLRAKAAAQNDGGMTAFAAEIGQRADESPPICLVATERKLLSSKLFYLALTNRRLVVKLAGGDTRTFDRGGVRLAIKQKTFADVGNMQTTYTHGWELQIQLPDGERHACRVYEHALGIPDHAAHVRAFVAAVA